MKGFWDAWLILINAAEYKIQNRDQDPMVMSERKFSMSKTRNLIPLFMICFSPSALINGLLWRCADLRQEVNTYHVN